MLTNRNDGELAVCVAVDSPDSPGGGSPVLDVGHPHRPVRAGQGSAFAPGVPRVRRLHLSYRSGGFWWCCEEGVAGGSQLGRHSLADQPRACGSDEASVCEHVRGRLVAARDSVDVEVRLAAPRHFGSPRGHSAKHRHRAARRHPCQGSGRGPFVRRLENRSTESQLVHRSSPQYETETLVNETP